jgi:glucose/arabinose dehydrogenase
VYVAQPPGSNRLFVVLQEGRIRIIERAVVRRRPFLDIEGLVSCCGERGLLSVAFPPDYQRSGRFYVNYTDRSGDTRVVEYRRSAADVSVADPGSARLVLTVRQPFPNHNGGAMQFGRGGALYVATGDGGGAGDPLDVAQDTSRRLGKILRVEDPTDLSRTVEVWAVGLRNPWRFSFDRANRDVWVADVGQATWEEVTRVPASALRGANFGWSRYEGRTLFDASRDLAAGWRLRSPATAYRHKAGRCSITGGYVYRGRRFDRLRGWYVFADYCTGELWRFSRGSGRRVRMDAASGTAGRVVSFGQGRTGELFVVSHDLGAVYRFVYR